MTRKKKEPCSSVNIYEKKKQTKKKQTNKHKFIVSYTKHIEKKKSYTALESKYSYRSSKIHLHLMNEMHFRLLKSTAHQKRVS